MVVGGGRWCWVVVRVGAGWFLVVLGGAKGRF